MKVFDSLKALEKTKEFIDWRTNNKEYYLVSLFYISDKPNEIQIDYYNSKKNTITSFNYSKNSVFVVKDSQVMSKTKKELKPLVLEGISEFDNALETALSYKKEKHSKEEVYKTIIILQNDDTITKEGRIIWNIIFITNSFKVINYKLDAKNLELLSQNINSIFSFIQK
jgi:hypothetical protein